MNRRQFMISSAITAAASGAVSDAQGAAPRACVDCNHYLGVWPFRRLPDEGDEVTFAMEPANTSWRAWVSSFEGVVRRDLAAENARIAKFCAERNKGEARLEPAGAINPKLPAWREDLPRCAREHGMRLIRLHPNYHGYTLDDPAFAQLLEAAAAARIGVQIVAQMEDERTQHPLMQVKPVDFKPLPALLKKMPEARVMVLNANRAMSMSALAGSGVWLDIAMLEGVGGVENLLRDWPQDRVVFGTCAPLFYPESGRLKLQESELTPAQLDAVTSRNAEAFLAWP